MTDRIVPSWREGAARAAIVDFLGEAATFESDEPILQTAERYGWTVVSMRSDWSTVFADS